MATEVESGADKEFKILIVVSRSDRALGVMQGQVAHVEAFITESAYDHTFG